MSTDSNNPSPELMMMATREGFSALSRLLETAKDLMAALDAANKAAGEFYWKQRDLRLAVLCSVTAIAVGMIRSQSGNVAVRSKVKALCYNLASYTWKGWDEPGIVIEPWQAELGFHAAKLNLQLAQELEKDVLARSRAHWMLGAHGLAREDYANAISHFETASEQAGLVNNRAESLLSEGFVQLIRSAQKVDGAAEQRNQIEEELSSLPDAVNFAEQLRTAARVFLQ